MDDFKKDSRLEIVYEDGRPSYYQEHSCELPELLTARNQQGKQRASKRLNGHSAGLVSDTEAAVEKPVGIVEEKLQHQPSPSASPCLDGSEEERITELARTLSYRDVENEKGVLINPFVQQWPHCYLIRQCR